MTKTQYVLYKAKATGNLFQMQDHTITFNVGIYGEYETLEEAEEAFFKCDAEQGIERKDTTGSTIYYAICYEIDRLEYDDEGKVIDSEVFADNYDDLDFSWADYEED